MPMTIKPALTAEEWAFDLEVSDDAYRGSGDSEGEGNTLLDEDGRVAVTYDSGIVYTSVRAEERHRLAALALYGQSFGFTFEDADAVRTAADVCVLAHPEWPEEDHARLYAIADRIKALLPPPTEG